MNNDNFEFKVGDRVMIEGVLVESDRGDYPLYFRSCTTPRLGALGFSITLDGRYEKDGGVVIKLIERPKPKLTFEFIRNNLVPMKHLLISEEGEKRLYLGFTRNCYLVTDSVKCEKDSYYFQEDTFTWNESEIKDWTYEEYNEN